MSLEEKHNEQSHSISDNSPLLRTKSNPEICSIKRSSIKRKLKIVTQNSFNQNENEAVCNGNKKIYNENGSFPDISAMSVVSLYEKQDSLEDMDTER